MRDKLREASIDNIDVLLLNAGISTPDTFVPSAQGYELVFATNHLGHFLLTHLVMPYMKHVSGSRVIVVSSLMHRFVHRINYKAAAGDQEEFSTRAYAESKLANHWFVAELNRRLQQAKVETVAVCAHPGVASTGILQVSSGLWVPWIVGHVFRLISQSAMKGAWPLLMAVGDEDMKRGEYYVPGGMWELWGLPKKGGILNPVVSRVDKAAELWEVSERLSGVSFRI